LRSYRKLIPALEQFSDYYIVTADDDIYYSRKWLEKLWYEHLKYPDNPVCHIAHKIIFKNKKVLPYTQWKKCIKTEETDFQIFGCGGGGILYHKKYLYKDINRKDIFMNLALYADDIWFYFMVVLNGNSYKIVRNPFNRIKYVNPYREYGLNEEYKLSTVNVEANLNDEQFKKVLEHYQLDLYSFINNSKN
jgi:hypothetical protein